MTTAAVATAKLANDRPPIIDASKRISRASANRTFHMSHDRSFDFNASSIMRPFRKSDHRTFGFGSHTMV